MDQKILHPDLRGPIGKLPKLPFDKPKLLPIARFLFNIAAQSKLDPRVSAETVKNGRQSIRVYSPKDEGSGKGVLWAFGGGHVAGKPAHLNALASKMVLQTGAKVFAPTYRLSPKHPFPADLDDCFSAWNWILDNAGALGVDKETLIIGGNSAGGGIAASLAQKILDAGGLQPLAQILFYPMLDDRTAANRTLDTDNHFVWSNSSNNVAWGAYLNPRKPGDENLPNYASAARRKDLSVLPPAWIGVGNIDLFAKEDLEYAERLKSAGVECHVELVEGAPHAFEAIAPKLDLSQKFVDSAIEFMKTKMS